MTDQLTLDLPTTALQHQVITQAADRAGLTVEDYTIQAALKLAVAHTQYGLTECVTDEQRHITDGHAEPCAATLAVTNPATNQTKTLTCIRHATHAADGVVAREAHVAEDTDTHGKPYLTQWTPHPPGGSE